MRILNYADKASSVASILSTATAEDYPELSKVLNVTSLVLGVADFSTNGVQSLKNLNANPSNAVNLINRSENVLDAGNHIQNVENLAMRILDETPDELMNQVLHSSNPHSRALLEDVLEKERHLAQGAHRTDVVAKLDEALEVVRGANSIWNNFLEDAFTLEMRAEVIEEGLPAKFPNLSIDELTAIKVYTSDESRNGVKIYAELNSQLRAGNLESYYHGLNQLLNNGLNKLPKYTGSKVYRGIYGAEVAIADNWNIGDLIDFNDFKSTSTSIETAAYAFSYNKGYDVVLEIKNEPVIIFVIFLVVRLKWKFCLLVVKNLK